MKKKYKVIVIFSLLVLLFLGALLIFSIKNIPDKRWANVKPGMDMKEIEGILGKPNHPSRDAKEMDRWIVDSILFNSRLIVYYRNPKRPTVASCVKITRYFKLTGRYSVNIIKE